MKPARSILAAAILLAAVAPVAAQDSPLDILQQLMRPPMKAVTNAFRPPRRAAKPPAQPKPAEADLLSVPMPRPRPDRAEAALGYAPTDPAPADAAPLDSAAVEAAPVPAAPATQEDPASAAPVQAAETPEKIEDKAGDDATAVAKAPEKPAEDAAEKPAPVAEAAPAPEAKPTVPTPQARPPIKLARVDPKPDLPPPAARSTCGIAIAQLGVEASPLAPISEGACGIAAPVAVSSLADGDLDFSSKAILGCDLAEVLARWTTDTVQPIAMKTIGKKVIGYRIAASYACRNRDNLPNTKLSEHAHGNAVDISAFRFEGLGWVEVKSGWAAGGSQSAFLKAVRKSACGPFTTVLGPGSDKFHTDHFHLDRAKRRTAGPSKGLYCH